MLHENIKTQLKDAMRAKDEVRVSTLRSILSGTTNELVAQGKKPDEAANDELVLTVIKRLVKQHKESIEQFENAGRSELAENETRELAILEEFLPEMMSKEAIKEAAQAKQEELGITDPAQKGKLIGALMKDLKGKADGAEVKAAVEEILSS